MRHTNNSISELKSFLPSGCSFIEIAFVKVGEALQHFSKVLRVVEILGGYGPLSSDEIVAQSGFTKSSVFRICKQLKESGWVEVQLNSNKMLLSSKLDMEFSNAKYYPTELAILKPFIDEIADEKIFHITLSSLTSLGLISDLDSTKVNVKLEKSHCFKFSPQAHVILTQLPKNQRLRNLEAHIQRVLPEPDVTAIAKQLDAELHLIRRAPYYLDLSPSHFLKYLRLDDAFDVCVTIEMRNPKQGNFDALFDRAAEMSSKLDVLAACSGSQLAKFAS